jgi:hypothetical protein
VPRLSLFALLVLGAIVPAAPAVAAGYREGVAAGNATATTARLWTRAPKPGPLTLQVSAHPDFAGTPAEVDLEAHAVHGNAVAATVRGLRPGRAYWYRFTQGGAVSPLGRFRTAPAPAAEAPVRFSVLAGLDAAADPRLRVLDRVTNRPNAFNVLLGEAVSTAGTTTLAEARARYSRLLTVPAMVQLRARAGLYATWGGGEAAGTGPVRRAFTEALPVQSSPATGFYRSVRWGETLELFVLDERTFRGRDASGACANPLVGFPDPAPTIPQPLREAWGKTVVYPLLAQVSDGCLRNLRSPRRTMLGHDQLAALRRDIAGSTARFKVLLSEHPLTQLYFDPYGRFEGYEAERSKLVAFLRDNVDGLVVMSAGGAGGVVAPVRTQTLEPPNPSLTGYLDVGAGPVAGATFEDRIRARLAEGDDYRKVSRVFFKRQPPEGAGVICAAGDRRNFAQVEVRDSRMTIRLIGADGRIVHDRDGTPCGPFRVDSGAQF